MLETVDSPCCNNSNFELGKNYVACFSLLRSPVKFVMYGFVKRTVVPVAQNLRLLLLRIQMSQCYGPGYKARYFKIVTVRLEGKFTIRVGYRN